MQSGFSKDPYILDRLIYDEMAGDMIPNSKFKKMPNLIKNNLKFAKKFKNLSPSIKRIIHNTHLQKFKCDFI